MTDPPPTLYRLLTNGEVEVAECSQCAAAAAERARIISALREPSNDLVELVDTAYRGDGWDGSFRRAIGAVAAWLEKSHAKATWDT